MTVLFFTACIAAIGVAVYDCVRLCVCSSSAARLLLLPAWLAQHAAAAAAAATARAADALVLIQRCWRRLFFSLEAGVLRCILLWGFELGVCGEVWQRV